MLNDDDSGQISTELILLLAGMIIIVIMAMSMYNNYMIDFSAEIEENEVKDLKNKIDELNSLMGGE
ncbi:MAG: hypothetical protein BZ138_05170 [Methanosphaera sp. rholeuAM270]|nr:MAG: hypothetical protein BZ138_05170 [Methanosphaera sp. rholeuAM270]